jgi:hypothetical protein
MLYFNNSSRIPTQLKFSFVSKGFVMQVVNDDRSDLSLLVPIIVAGGGGGISDLSGI